MRYSLSASFAQASMDFSALVPRVLGFGLVAAFAPVFLARQTLSRPGNENVDAVLAVGASADTRGHSAQFASACATLCFRSRGPFPEGIDSGASALVGEFSFWNAPE